MTSESTRRSGGSAAALSLLLPGLGQVYCGVLIGGLGYMAAATVLMATSMMMMGSSGITTGFWIAVAATSAVSIVAAATAFRTARRTRVDYKLKEYNRWYVYALLVAIGTGGAGAYGVLIRERFVQAFIVPNASMHPTIQKGDRLLAKKGIYLDRDPMRGEVVVFRNPGERRKIFVKRVVGLPGDEIEQRGGRLHLNGEPAALEPAGRDGEERIFRERIEDASYRIHDAEDGGKGDFAAVTVPAGHCFVMGDNRDTSRDSRYFGPVPFSSLEGRATVLFWPGTGWSRFGKIE